MYPQGMIELKFAGVSALKTVPWKRARDMRAAKQRSLP